MPTNDVVARPLSFLTETYSVCEEMLYPVERSVRDLGRPQVFAAQWAASGPGCSILAHGIEQRIADVIFDGATSGAYGVLWDLVVTGGTPTPSGDLEHDVLLPAQPPRRVRSLTGRVQRVVRAWPGLALSEGEIEASYVGLGDA